jgi:hypothetical protein
MKKYLGTTLTFILLVLLCNVGEAQLTNDQKVKVRIKNESKFLITKLTILGKDFENIEHGDTSDYFEVKPFYPSMKVDITIQRKRTLRRDLWSHTISYPVDHVGEKLIINEKNTIVINIQKGQEKGQVEVETNVIKE